MEIALFSVLADTWSGSSSVCESCKSLYYHCTKVQFVLLNHEWMDCKAAFLHSLQALLLVVVTVIQKSVTRLKLNRSNKQ